MPTLDQALRTERRHTLMLVLGGINVAICAARKNDPMMIAWGAFTASEMMHFLGAGPRVQIVASLVSMVIMLACAAVALWGHI